MCDSSDSCLVGLCLFVLERSPGVLGALSAPVILVMAFSVLVLKSCLNQQSFFRFFFFLILDSCVVLEEEVRRVQLGWSHWLLPCIFLFLIFMCVCAVSFWMILYWQFVVQTGEETKISFLMCSKQISSLAGS